MASPLFWWLAKVLFREKRDKKYRRCVKDSGFFDGEWYLAQNPDVVAAGVDPLEHFCEFGDRELRQPSAQFDSHLYAKLFRMNLSEMGPLEHLITRGEPFRHRVRLLLAKLESERDDYRLRYYALKASFDRCVAEADLARQLYAKEMAKNKITVLSGD